MDEVAVEAWTEGYLSYPEGAADPVVSPVYHVTVYPKTAAPLQALGAAGWPACAWISRQTAR